MQLLYVWIALTALVLFLDLWVLNSTWRSDVSDITKAMWTALVCLIPVLGAIIWAVWGPRGVTKDPSSPEHSKG